MKLFSLFLLSMVTVSGVGAATIIDVTGDAAATVKRGDTLAFEILSRSFSTNAASFGLEPNPTTVSFALISTPIADVGSFTVWLGSADGAVSVDLGGPLAFVNGSFSGSGYQGLVSTLQGYTQLSPVVSQAIFGGGSGVLTFRNEGPEVTLDLSPYTLRQDLLVSLGDGPLTVGGIVGSVTLRSEGGGSPLPAANLQSFVFSEAPASAVPEPHSSMLLLGGGFFLCSLSVSATLRQGETRLTVAPPTKTPQTTLAEPDRTTSPIPEAGSAGSDTFHRGPEL